MLTATKTYCVKLYAQLPSLLEPFADKFNGLYDWDARRDIEDLVNKAVPGAEELGACGGTITYNIDEADMPALLAAIQTYNNQDKVTHIIHIELY